MPDKGVSSQSHTVQDGDVDHSVCPKGCGEIALGLFNTVPLHAVLASELVNVRENNLVIC